MLGTRAPPINATYSPGIVGDLGRDRSDGAELVLECGLGSRVSDWLRLWVRPSTSSLSSCGCTGRSSSSSSSRRMHFNIRQALFKACDGNQSKWHSVVTLVMWADRVTVC